MGLALNSNDARKADNISSVIKESGRYVGIITRAEKLKSHNGVDGVGFSFKSDDDATANYLDVYTVKPDGEKLRGYNIVQAILCCTKLRGAEEGPITFQKWDKQAGQMVQATATGYPSLMGKRVGLLLQRELGTNQNTGADTDRMNIFAVFEAATGFMASEILDNKTKAERLEQVSRILAATPVRDTRKNVRATAPANGNGPAPTGGFDDDIPF